MKLSRNGTCQFAHENCAQDALYFDGWDETTKTVETTASTSMVKTRMDGENANANGNYGSLLNETESIAIEEAEEAGRSSEDDEEEDGEEEEAPKAPLTSSERHDDEDNNDNNGECGVFWKIHESKEVAENESWRIERES